MKWGLLASTHCMAPDDGGSAAPDAPVVEVAALDAPAVDSPTDAPAPTEPAAETPPEKPKQGDRRFAIMTAKLKAEESARHAAESRASAAEALLNVGKEDPDRLAPARREATQDVESAAARLIAQREHDARRQAVVTEGAKEFPDWHEKAEILHGMGATSNAAFMEALVELPNATKIVAHLAEDADALVALLGKSPTAMAAAMGRLDAQVGRTAVKPLSNAPAPAPRVQASGVVPEANPHNYPDNMSMKEWSKMMDAHLPVHLGGKKKSA